MTVPATRTTATVAVAVLLVTAGCIGNFGGGGGSADSPPPLAHVPGNADFLGSYDADVVSDPATTEVINTMLRETVPADSDQPRSVEELFEEFQNDTADDTNLSPSGISGASVFVEYPQMGSIMGPSAPSEMSENVYVGVLLRTSWSEEDVVSEIESDDEVTEETYEGTTIYTVESDYTGDSGGGPTFALAMYEENLMAFGTEEAVKDVIDVAAGREDAVSGDLRDAYESTRSDAYLRFAAAIPEQYREMATRPGMGGGAVPGLANLTAVSGAYYTEGGQDGTIGMAMNMHLDGEEPADEMEAGVQTGLSVLESQIRNETIRSHVDRINVSRDSTTVTVRYESPVGEITTAIEQFADPQALPMGPGTGLGGEEVTRPPQVTFDYEYQDGTLTAIHAGGETIDGENLRATCGGPTLDVPAGELAAGDTVVETTECEPGDTLRIIWSGGDTQRILGQYDVPESGDVSAALTVVTG